MKTVFYLIALGLILTACNAAQPVAPEQALATTRTAWNASRHTVWDIDWPNAPLAGEVTVEEWRAGSRLRLEILETNAPDLLGQTLVINGNQAWRFNRLDLPASESPTTPVLSPVTDAFAQIERLLAQSPASATSRQVVVNTVAATEIELRLAAGETLRVAVAQTTGLPVFVEFTAGSQHGRLRARSALPLEHPPAALFAVN